MTLKGAVDVNINGLINNFAIDLGIWDTPIKLAHNLNGTLIGMVHIMLPFLVLPLYAAMQRIDRIYIYLTVACCFASLAARSRLPALAHDHLLLTPTGERS